MELLRLPDGRSYYVQEVKELEWTEEEWEAWEASGAGMNELYPDDKAEEQDDEQPDEEENKEEERDHQPARKRARTFDSVEASRLLLQCNANLENQRRCNNQASADCVNVRCRRHCNELAEMHGSEYACEKCTLGYQSSDEQSRWQRTRRPGPNYRKR
jgi:hypothetical protein